MEERWLSLSIWLPIAAGLVVLATGGDKTARTARVLALVGAVAGFLVTIPLVTGFDTGTGSMQFVEFSPWIARFRQLPSRGGRHFGAVHPAEQLHHRAGGDCGLGSDPVPGGAVHGLLPFPVGSAERGVRIIGCAAVLRLLRGDGDS